MMALKLKLAKSRFTFRECLHPLLSQSKTPRRSSRPCQAGMLKGELCYQTGRTRRLQQIRHPPPPDSKPEAMNFPATIYEMSKSSAPFVPPQRYPSPPKDMWYEVPEKAPAAPSEPLKPLFPWESYQTKPSRVFDDDQPSPETLPSAESSAAEPSTVEQKSGPATPITPTIHITLSDPWSSFTRTNAWDEVPAIERYVDTIQKKSRRSRTNKSPGVIALPSPSEVADGVTGRRRGSRLTDFPSEVERPSLPVTPAPIRRQTFWDGGRPGIGDDGAILPAAAGVPGQSDWVCVHGHRWTPADCLCELTNALRVHKDPVAQLQKLARQHSEKILEKLSGSGRDSSDLPPRDVPFGSEELVSPTYVARTTQVLSPRPVKGSSLSNIITDLEVTTKAVSDSSVSDSQGPTLK
jgi:hypothetical protein